MKLGFLAGRITDIMHVQQYMALASPTFALAGGIPDHRGLHLQRSLHRRALD